MRNIFFVIILSTILFPACSGSKSASSEGSSSSGEKKAAEKFFIRKAIEERKYVIMVDRIIPSRGRPVELVPRNNFIIIDGELASVSMAYLGRSFGIRKITGINFNGHIGRYEMKTDDKKDVYKINVEVIKDNDKFNIYMSLGANGFCSISVTNPYIETVNYHGTIVPLEDYRPPTVPTMKSTI
ncbi:MAG: DUF4251 domain-containing protein [Bacteroidales bacterium]|nr:DUF4251 domain-containing protein [Bacteroidales bacterium]